MAPLGPRLEVQEGGQSHGGYLENVIGGGKIILLRETLGTNVGFLSWNEQVD